MAVRLAWPLGPDLLQRYLELARRINTDNLPDLT
jgi:hypothetical protein